MKKRKRVNKLYPVLYEGKWLKEDDCDSVFAAFYHSKLSLNDAGGVYLAEGDWVYPDGHIDQW